MGMGEAGEESGVMEKSSREFGDGQGVGCVWRGDRVNTQVSAATAAATAADGGVFVAAWRCSSAATQGEAEDWLVVLDGNSTGSSVSVVSCRQTDARSDDAFSILNTVINELNLSESLVYRRRLPVAILLYHVVFFIIFLYTYVFSFISSSSSWFPTRNRYSFFFYMPCFFLSFITLSNVCPLILHSSPCSVIPTLALLSSMCSLKFQLSSSSSKYTWPVSIFLITSTLLARPIHVILSILLL